MLHIMLSNSALQFAPLPIRLYNNCHIPPSPVWGLICFESREQKPTNEMQQDNTAGTESFSNLWNLQSEHVCAFSWKQSCNGRKRYVFFKYQFCSAWVHL